MASLTSHHFSTTTTTLFIIVLLHHFIHPVSTSIQPRELLYEEKNKLGSMPPSCHSKCNECHPCMAVQVPSLPNHDDSLPPQLSKASSLKKLLTPSLQGNNNRYSNYKPLGWKCHCGDHFFNP